MVEGERKKNKLWFIFAYLACANICTLSVRQQEQYLPCFINNSSTFDGRFEDEGEFFMRLLDIAFIHKIYVLDYFENSIFGCEQWQI